MNPAYNEKETEASDKDVSQFLNYINNSRGESEVESNKNVCIPNILSVYTLKDIFEYFFENPSELFENPRDFVSAYYFSFLPYNRELFEQIWFTSNKIKIRGSEHVCETKVLKAKGKSTPLVLRVKLTNNDINKNDNLYSKYKLYYGIRGTQTIRDFVGVNLRIRESPKIPKFLHSLNKIGNVNPNEYFNDLKGKVHGGMLNHALEVLSMINNDIKNINEKSQIEIFLYGHSLGAATAAITSALLKELKYENVTCSCLSCPKCFVHDCRLLKYEFDYQHWYTEGDMIVEKSDKFSSIVKNLFSFLKKKQVFVHYNNENIKLPFIGTAKGKDKILDAHRIFTFPSMLKSTIRRFSTIPRLTVIEHDYMRLKICSAINNIIEEINTSEGGGSKKLCLLGRVRKIKRDARGLYVTYKGGRLSLAKALKQDSSYESRQHSRL